MRPRRPSMHAHLGVANIHLQSTPHKSPALVNKFKPVFSNYNKEPRVSVAVNSIITPIICMHICSQVCIMEATAWDRAARGHYADNLSPLLRSIQWLEGGQKLHSQITTKTEFSWSGQCRSFSWDPRWMYLCRGGQKRSRCPNGSCGIPDESGRNRRSSTVVYWIREVVNCNTKEKTIKVRIVHIYSL